MASIEQRLLKLEVANTAQLRAATDTERAIRLRTFLQSGHPRNAAAHALMARLCPVVGESVAEG